MASELNSRSLASLRGRIGAFVLHSRYDSRELTASAREAFEKRFLDQVDKDRVLSEGERNRRAQHAKTAHFSRLPLASAKARAKRNTSR